MEYKAGDEILIWPTGCINDEVAIVVDPVGTKLHPGPWVKVKGDPMNWILKTGDFLIVSNNAI